MCDTVVVVTSDRVFFAKNSDRDPNEAQLLEWHPRKKHAEGESVRCTWIEIPQAKETHAVLLSRPFWMWGGEMGVNEHGVAIGNEAVFTKRPHARTGLTGMDLLRLALERADSAEKACDVIVKLMERHGQGGGCGHENRGFTYHNSFIAADPKEACVLETAGKHWALERVESGVRTISNGLTISGFAEKHSDFLKTNVSRCAVRQPRTTELAEDAVSVWDLMRLLRDHGAGRTAPAYSWLNGSMDAPCMHGGGVAVGSQTTGSLVSELSPSGCRHWVTGTAAPCTGLFKPVSVGNPLDLGPPPTDRADDRSLWWRHERLHRRVLKDPLRLSPFFAPERDEVESRWIESPPESKEAFAEGDRLLEQWLDAIMREPIQDRRPLWARWYWRKRNSRAGLEME